MIPLLVAQGLAAVGGGGWDPARLRQDLLVRSSSWSTRLALLRAGITAATSTGATTSSWTTTPTFCFSSRCRRSGSSSSSSSTGGGLQRTLNGVTTWPFGHDFGMAVWCRLEPPPPPPPAASSQDNDDNDNDDDDDHEMDLLRIRTENGGGLAISIVPLWTPVTTTSRTPTTPEAYTIAITISDSQDGTATQPPVTLVTSRHGIVLLPHVWYHIAVRHCRSRLKGVFSLSSSREQLSVFLDGKCMCTESLAFPNITDVLYSTADHSPLNPFSSTTTKGTSSSSSLLNLRPSRISRPRASMNVTISFGSKFVGQTGALYVFNDHVSDATIRALYEIASGVMATVNSSVKTAATTSHAHRTDGTDPSILRRTVDTWDAQRSDMVRNSRLLDVHLKLEDAEELVLRQRRTSVYHKQRMIYKMIRVLDLADSDDYHNTNDFDMPEYFIHLQKSAFRSKLFLVWDPQRTLDNKLALELRIGAHVNMIDVYTWRFSSVQNVINSVGGIQSLLPLIKSILECEIESEDFAVNDEDGIVRPHANVMAVIPNLIRLLSAFIKDHYDNARELLRCGGVDVLEQLLHSCKKVAMSRKSKSSLFVSITTYPQIAQELVNALLDLRTSCSHFISLETKVYSRLLYNIPLWFSGFSQLPGAALHTEFLPVLSSLTRLNPEKVRDCVGVKDMVVVLREYFVPQTNEMTINDDLDRYNTTTTVPSLLCHSMSQIERHHASRILLGMIFTVLATGTNVQSLAPFLNLISHSLEGAFSGIVHQTEDRQLAIETCMVMFLLLQLRPLVDGLYESFAQVCGGVQGGASWILMAIVNVPDDEVRAIGIRCIATYLEVTNRGPDMPLSLGTVVKQIITSHEAHNDVSATMRRASTRITEIAKGLATGSQSYRPTILQTPRPTARVVYKVCSERISFFNCLFTNTYISYRYFFA